MSWKISFNLPRYRKPKETTGVDETFTRCIRPKQRKGRSVFWSGRVHLVSGITRQKHIQGLTA